MTVKRLYAYVVLVLENQENSRNSHSRGSHIWVGCTKCAELMYACNLKKQRKDNRWLSIDECDVQLVLAQRRWRTFLFNTLFCFSVMFEFVLKIFS